MREKCGTPSCILWHGSGFAIWCSGYTHFLQHFTARLFTTLRCKTLRFKVYMAPPVPRVASGATSDPQIMQLRVLTCSGAEFIFVVSFSLIPTLDSRVGSKPAFITATEISFVLRFLSPLSPDLLLLPWLTFPSIHLPMILYWMPTWEVLLSRTWGQIDLVCCT